MRLFKRSRVPRDHTPCSTCGHPREEHEDWRGECGECEDEVEMGDRGPGDVCAEYVPPL